MSSHFSMTFNQGHCSIPIIYVCSMNLLRWLQLTLTTVNWRNPAYVLCRCLKASNNPEVTASAQKLLTALGKLSEIISTQPELLQTYGGRDFAFSLANIYIGGLLLEHALASGNRLDVQTVRQWTLRDLTPIATLAKQNGYKISTSEISDFVYEGYE